MKISSNKKRKNFSGLIARFHRSIDWASCFFFGISFLFLLHQSRSRISGNSRNKRMNKMNKARTFFAILCFAYFPSTSRCPLRDRVSLNANTHNNKAISTTTHTFTDMSTKCSVWISYFPRANEDVIRMSVRLRRNEVKNWGGKNALISHKNNDFLLFGRCPKLLLMRVSLSLCFFLLSIYTAEVPNSRFGTETDRLTSGRMGESGQS